MCEILPRLKELAANEGITIVALERSIGASKGVISRAINNGTDIQSKWLQAIVENYPQYSAQWLLSGQGDMMRSHNIKTEEVNCELNSDIETRPRIPLDAAAGTLSLISESVSENECERLPIITRFPEYDFTIIRPYSA